MKHRTPWKVKNVMSTSIEVSRRTSPAKVLITGTTSFGEAAEACSAAAEREQTDQQELLTVPRHPYDVAYSLAKLAEERYGTFAGADIPCPGGPACASSPPKCREKKPLAFTKIQGLDVLTSGIKPYNREWTVGVAGGDITGSTLIAYCKGINEKEVRQFLAEVAEAAMQSPVIAGNAWDVIFTDTPFGRMTTVKPLNLAQMRQPCLNAETLAALDMMIWSVIENPARAKSCGMSVSRGALLHGPFGTGKSMAVTVTANNAIKQRWSVFSCSSAKTLSDTVKIARRYAPSLVIVEDIDRVCGPLRDGNTDTILNAIDSATTKGTDPLIILATTNQVENVYPGLLRQERLTPIEVGVPDEDTRAMILSAYGLSRAISDTISPSLEGEVGSALREVSGLAQLSARLKERDVTEQDARNAVGVVHACAAPTTQTTDRIERVSRLGQEIGLELLVSVNGHLRDEDEE